MKAKAIRVRILCEPSSYSDKGRKLISAPSFNEPTILEEHSVASGVVLRKHCCSSKSEYGLKTKYIRILL